MAKLVRMTRGRVWAARLLVLIPVMALVGLMVAVLPAGASHDGSPPSTNFVDPDKLQTVGGDFANCTAAEAHEGLPAGTITAFAFTNNPAQVTGQRLAVTDPQGNPVPGNWYVVLTMPDPAGHSRSFAYTVYHDGVATQSDGKLEAPRKQPNKTENLSHVTVCFSEGAAGLQADFVEVKGAQGTNHYFNDLQTVGCDPVIVEDGDVSATFTRQDSQTCGENPKVAVVFASDANNQVGFFPQGNQQVNYIGVITFNPKVATNPSDHEILYDPDGGGPVLEKKMKWCGLGPSMPSGESWCIVKLEVNVYSDTQTQPTWRVLGFDDPLVRGR